MGKTRRGELWQLGRHRFLCGDATSAEDVARCLQGANPHLMVTDPPYGVAYDPRWRLGRVGRRNGSAIAGRAMAGDNIADWRRAWANFAGDVAYVWHAGKHGAVVAASLQAAGFEIRTQIVWAKSHFAISRGHYHWQHECCFYAVRRGRTGHWTGDRKQSTVWRMSSPINGFNRGRTATYSGHGAQKPLEAMARPMRNNARAGDAVFDPFLGSGTSLIAAEREGRTCLGLEIDPACCDMILARWRAEIGTEPRRLDYR